MVAMDIAVARKLRNILTAGSRGLTMEGDQRACWALLDVLEAGQFAHPDEVLTMLRRASEAIGGDNRNQKFYSDRLARLVERAEQETKQLERG